MDFDPPRWLPDPVDTETGQQEENKTSVGSGVRLRDELVEMNRSLGLSVRWDTGEMGAGSSEKDPYLREVHAGWLLMEGFVRTSLQYQLPICFD